LRVVIRTDVTSKYAALVFAMDQRPSLEAAIEAARTGVEVSRQRYQAGAAPLTDVILTEDDREQVELALVNNAVDVAVGRLTLDGAVGSL
jgi:outer membrane protein TolC